MCHAKDEMREDDTSYGHVATANLTDLWANEQTLDACRDELKDVIEGWLMLGIAMHHEIPPIDAIAINVGVTA